MTSPVHNRFSNPSVDTGHYPLHLSLTELCRKSNCTALQVHQAIRDGKQPDQETVEAAIQRTATALMQCGSCGPSYASEETAQEFYAWESVINALIEKKAPITKSAIGASYGIGRGMPEKLQKAQQAQSECRLF